VDKRGGERYGLGELGAAVAGNAAIAAMVEHHIAFYADLQDPVALLEGQRPHTALATYWPYAAAARPGALGSESVAAYSSLMSTSQSLIAGEVLAAYDFSRHRCLLDVGGGEGAFLTAVAANHAQLRLVLFDLPSVADIARVRFAASGLERRATAIGGDFLADPLPDGADVISLVRVIHDHDEARALTILRAANRALPAGGTLLLAEPMSGTPGAEPMGDAYFGFYLLAMGRGRPRSPAELAEMLRTAGFVQVNQVATRIPLQTGLVVARKS
jgi:demethylspheroidene O-methyltransferase